MGGMRTECPGCGHLFFKVPRVCPHCGSEKESDLYRRLRKYGTRGIVRVPSVEGAPVSAEAARNLQPPDC